MSCRFSDWFGMQDYNSCLSEYSNRGEQGSCGDGFCADSETNETCPSDCVNFCDNDGICEMGENPRRCGDCGGVIKPSYCGDGVCDDNEDSDSCVEDCPIAEDTIYPVFYNYADDSATLIENGVGFFNVTVDNANGTVLLEINGTNLTATNLGGNIYGANYNFLASGIYSYRWHAWGSGVSHNYNVSAE
jgi:hypothetical protein